MLPGFRGYQQRLRIEIFNSNDLLNWVQSQQALDQNGNADPRHIGKNPLLCQALIQTGRAALGQYAARGKQQMVLVRPMGEVLVMEQLHYAAEIRPASEVPIPEAAVKEAELKLAVQLIEQGATDEFRPAAYHDTVRERVLQAIQQKVEGKEIVAEAPEAQETKIIDLMEALKASLAKGGHAPAGKQPAKKVEKPGAERTVEKPVRTRKKAAG